MENVPGVDIATVDSTTEAFAIHKSRVALALKLGLAVFLLDTFFALVVLVYLSVVAAGASYAFLVFLLALHTAKYLVLTAIALRLFYIWGSAFYEVRQGQLFILEGYTQITERAYDLSQLGQLDIRQDWVGRRLNYGNLDLHIATPGGQRLLILSDIRRPYEYATRLSRHLRTTRFVRSRQ